MKKQRLIKSWKPLDTETDAYCASVSKFDGQYQLIHESFGDYSIEWIAEYDENGKELRRWNTKGVDFIEWL
jgi:hypothetical protein